MTPLKLGFAGFRHAHIFDLYQRALDDRNIEVTGTWEKDFPASLMPSRSLSPSHHSYEDLLASCDAVAVGDAYGRRGQIVLQALRAGRHVIADKPLCTSIDEFHEIELLSKEKHLCVGLMLDLRDHSNLICLRDIVRSGRIGEVQTVTFSAQHPLLWGVRPSWYFETGMHGGTLNDIAIHAMDFLPWVTGLQVVKVDAARTWNAKATKARHFNDCGHFLLRLSNGGGVFGDVSYLAPDKCGYAIPNYWRITIHGTSGFAETSYNVSGVILAEDHFTEPQIIPPAPALPGGYLADFMADVSGNPREEGRTTMSCLRATRQALELESAAQMS